MKRSESQNVEYKRSWHDEYPRWACGFANGKGGTIRSGIDGMDYMERKGSGFGLIFDAYENEAQNPSHLNPSFVSAVGCFRVILPNLNHGLEGHGTQDGTQGVIAGDAQPDTQGDTQGATQADRLGEIERKIIDFIRQDSKIGVKRMAERLGVSIFTVKHRIAKMPNVRFVGHGFSGQWEVFG